MHINYDFADLEVFLAVKETESFHLAAQKLNLSQSAITRRVQKLETALDSVLFERTTRRVRPTLAAKRLQARAESILEDARETSRAMRDESVAFAHQRGRVVTLATIPTIVANVIAPAIGLMRAEGHMARFRLLDLAANEVSEAVAQGEADLGIGWIPSLEANTEFAPLFDDRMVLAMPSHHRLCRQQTVTWDDLEDEPLILPARGTGNRMLIDETSARRRRMLTWAFEAERSTTALSLVVGDAGVAILPGQALLEARDDRVIGRPLVEPEILRPIGLLTRTGQADTVEIAALKASLQAVCANPPGHDVLAGSVSEQEA